MTPRDLSPDLEAQDEEEEQYGCRPGSDEHHELYPDKPVNHAKTLPFHVLFTTLFNPLIENSKKRTNADKVARAKQGPHGNNRRTPHEQRNIIIQRFVSRWRQEVGNDFYPALRLILPEKDRDRAMYGLKEKAIARLIVKMLKIDKDSDDAQKLLNWKVPGKSFAARMAGDFPGRCYEALSKRPGAVSSIGSMRIGEVNALLDRLSAASKESEQLPIFEEFYNRMSAEEMTWLIRVILRQMKIGASEKTILDIWHPDGEALFNFTSSLRRVCWDLTDPNVRQSKDRGIEPMQCFQPQLAQFQMHSFQKMIEKMGCGTPDNPNFWIEEKLDGERMQMHMVRNDDSRKYPGGFKFGFWSRNGKDYTYLYGSSFGDDNSALTRHIKNAFDEGVDSIILDGEMITWNPVTNTMVAFGTLKTAALSEKANPFEGTGERPLLRVFDCLYLNGVDLRQHTLIERRAVLSRCITNVEKRIEIHDYIETSKVDDIDQELRRVVEESSEGLVLKNPLSVYRLNSRNDDWMKVKPEYMTGFGESFDCIVIGGYFGQGRRGGAHASFLCGLRVDDNHISAGANPMQCHSFFKVGGGLRQGDLAKIKHITEGKWRDWDKNNPPTDFIKLGGGDRQYERPDQWIKPSDSFVLEVKAASLGISEQYGTGFTLRFPRMKRLRDDKNWDEALSIYEFAKLKEKVEAEEKSKGFTVDSKRKIAKRLKKELAIAGNDTKIRTPYAGPRTELFEGLNFCVMSEMLKPKKSKAAIEQIIKNNGGTIFASATAREDIFCIADKRTIPVDSQIKLGNSIIKPAWIFDAIAQVERDGPERSKFLVPFEPIHMLSISAEAENAISANVDYYSDSYARDVTPQELKRIMDDMIHPKDYEFSATQFLTELEERGKGLGELPSEIFRRCVVRFISLDRSDDIDLSIAKNQFLFGSGKIADMDDDPSITHFVLVERDAEVARSLRQTMATRGGKVARIVDVRWVVESWLEKTLLDEDRYVVTN